MRILLSLGLLLALIATVSAQPRHLRGIKPSEQSKYTGAQFTCFDQSATIPSNQVNDDYCDCADGSDDPGTSACVSSQFYCVNKRATPLTLPSSRVNDMICDCCDGSDEWMNLSGTPCPNTCAEEGRARHAAILAEIATTEQGLKVRTEMVGRAQQMKREKETLRASLDVKLTERRAALDQARAAQTVEEEKENAERARLQAIEDEKHAVDPEFQALAEAAAAAAKASAEAEAVKVDEAHVPASETVPVAEADASAFPYPAEYAYKPAEEEKKVEQEIASFPYPQEYAYQATGEEGKKEEIQEEPKQEIKEEDPYYSEFKEDEPSVASATVSYVLDSAETARQATREAEEKVTRSQNKLNELDEWLNADYGTDLEFAEMADQCFTLNDKQYVYEICVLKEAHQREGGSSTSLGRWTGIRTPDGDHEFTRFSFENGAGCWQGPSRSLDVNLICGVENQLKTVEEPSRCVYLMTMTTPALCSAERAALLKKQLADQTAEEAADE